MRVYVEISKNHGYGLGYVISHQFDPEIQLLIHYYNYNFRMEQKEYEKMEKEAKKENKTVWRG